MKKTYLFQFLILVSLSTLVACGQWSQDPLKDAHGKMGPGQQKPVDPTDPQDIMGSDFLKIDSPLFKLVKEGELGEIDISARVNATAAYSVSLRVTNLASFVGATFNGGTFRWTPPIGTATDEITELPIEIEAIASLPGKPVIKTTMKTILGVSRALLKPTITQVSTQQSSLREGATDYLYVTVEDLSVGATSPTTDYPVLVPQNVNGYPNLASFVEVQAPTKSSTGKFEFTVQVNLRNAELTKDRSDYAAMLVPVSHLNVVGQGRQLKYSVLTSLSKVNSTWATEVATQKGTSMDFQFLVLDPKNEGKIELTSTGTLPAGATLTCPSLNKPYLNCRFKWDVPAAQAAGLLSLAPTFTTKSMDWSDTFTVTTTLNLPISVQ